MNRHINLRQTGFSIVEIMVGLTVGLVALLVMLGLYAGFEAQKRTTTSGSDAQTTGAVGLHAIVRDVRMAGYGFSNLSALNCKVYAYNDLRSTPEYTFSTGLAPVVINPAGIGIPAADANTDILQITYGTSDGTTLGVSFTQPAASSANYKVTNRAGFNIGNFVLATAPGKDCALTQVTDLPASGICGTGGSPTQTDVVIHGSGSFQDPHQNCATVQAHYNPPSGFSSATVDYSTTGGTLFDMGSLPVTVFYAVRNGSLTRCDAASQDCTQNNTTSWVPIADNIVALQAQYGRDTTAPMDMVVNTAAGDVYDKTTPSGANAACGFARIPVVHVALLARSTNYEKAVVTSAAPSWFGGAAGTFGTSQLPTDWQHYRYKVFETIIPIRNILWMGVQPTC